MIRESSAYTGMYAPRVHDVEVLVGIRHKLAVEELESAGGTRENARRQLRRLRVNRTTGDTDVQFGATILGSNVSFQFHR